jgi:hypothetical protein
VREPSGPHEVDFPDWLAEARETLDHAGDFVAYDEDGKLRLVELNCGWTRIGRSLAADVRFDDPTVSRRHAMLHREDGTARILDDRSLNGVFVNGERVEMRELSDGDELTIGRFRLYYLSLSGAGAHGSGLGAPGAFA